MKEPTANSLYKYVFPVHQRRHLCKRTGLTNDGTAGNPNTNTELHIYAAQKDTEHGRFFLMTNDNQDPKTHRTQRISIPQLGCSNKTSWWQVQKTLKTTVKLQNSLLKDTGGAKNLDSESNSMCPSAAGKPLNQIAETSEGFPGKITACTSRSCILLRTGWYWALSEMCCWAPKTLIQATPTFRTFSLELQKHQPSD